MAVGCSGHTYKDSSEEPGSDDVALAHLIWLIQKDKLVKTGMISDAKVGVLENWPWQRCYLLG